MTECDHEQPQKIAQQNERHWTMLIIATIVVVLSFALQVRDDQRVEFEVYPGIPMPESCMSRTLFGFECPGCGLTRSFVFLAHGDWARSFAMHRVGWILALAVLAQFPYRWFQLRHVPLANTPVWPRLFGWLLIAALIANWLFNVVTKMRS